MQYSQPQYDRPPYEAVYHQNQFNQQNQGPYQNQMAVYPQQQGGYPPNQIQNPQYQGQPYQQVYPNQFQGNYPPQSTNIGFNFQPGIILEGDKLCFYCNRPYNLVQQRKIGGQVFLAFLLLLIFFWPLCWLPFVMEDCKDKYYYCSQCGKLIYKRQYTMMS